MLADFRPASSLEDDKLGWHESGMQDGRPERSAEDAGEMLTHEADRAKDVSSVAKQNKRGGGLYNPGDDRADNSPRTCQQSSSHKQSATPSIIQLPRPPPLSNIP